MGGIISILSGKPEIGHMWFVESLLVFSLVYAVIRHWVSPIDSECNSKPARLRRLAGPRTIIGLLIVALLMGIGSYFIRQVSPQDHWIWPFGIIPLPMEPAHYLQYVMMFVLGILAYRFQWLDKMSNSVGFMALLIGIALAMGNYLRDGGPWDAFVWQWFGIYESLMCVFISFGLLWLFREYGSWHSKFWQWCAVQAYGAYIVHLLLMIALQNVVDGIWMGAFGKFMFIGVITTIASFGLTWLLRMIPGVKKVL
jgi:surface polysaccharide O-acyltransferase-like enzyme